MTNEEKKSRIRALNDQLRKGEVSDKGTILVTSGVQEKGYEFLLAASRAVMDFDAFTPDNDPHSEHDFGSVEVMGETVFWKVDAYDLAMTYGSPDPSDPAVTHRVLTIMLSREY